MDPCANEEILASHRNRGETNPQISGWLLYFCNSDVSLDLRPPGANRRRVGASPFGEVTCF
jgi:hypothetical protein